MAFLGSLVNTHVKVKSFLKAYLLSSFEETVFYHNISTTFTFGKHKFKEKRNFYILRNTNF